MKSVYLKNWLFGKGAVVICREDLFIFKLKRVLGHLKPENFSARSSPRFARFGAALRAGIRATRGLFPVKWETIPLLINMGGVLIS